VAEILSAKSMIASGITNDDLTFNTNLGTSFFQKLFLREFSNSTARNKSIVCYVPMVQTKRSQRGNRN
jgi:hypothetical protein